MYKTFKQIGPKSNFTKFRVILGSTFHFRQTNFLYHQGMILFIFIQRLVNDNTFVKSTYFE